MSLPLAQGWSTGCIQILHSANAKSHRFNVSNLFVGQD